jgi:uncharacterized repeat protein (TIGR02059 family)
MNMNTRFLFISVFIGLCGVINSQDPGFFLDDWKKKNAEKPDYMLVEKPVDDPTITIQVNMDSILQKIGPYIFGNNEVNWVGKMQNNETLVRNIQNLSPNVLRLPGGSMSNEYFWDAVEGGGPSDLPPNIEVGVLQAGRNTANWAMNLDEYYELIENTHSTPCICVNYGYARYGTGPDPVATAAHYAAEWVRFDNGRTKFWEIGNENFGNWEKSYQIDLSLNQDGQPEFINGALYGQHCRVFIDSMRAAAADIGSEIKIGVVAYDAENSWTELEADWNELMMPEVGDMADFYIVHSYFTPWEEDSDVSTILSTHDVPRKIMEVIENDVNDAGMPMIPVALTEWNIRAINSMQQVSYINGIHSALVLGELVLNNYGFATRWDLANGWGNGDDQGMFSTGNEPGVVLFNPRPVFYYMYYFQKYMGDRMVNTSVTGNEDIIAYASSFSSGECGLSIINKSNAEEVAFVEIKNFKPGSNYYYFTLVGGDDNGDFSRKVFVNGQGPSGEGGGPDGYVDLKAFASPVDGGISVQVPPLTVIYVLVDKIPPPEYLYSKVDTNAKLISVEFTQGMIVPENPAGFDVIINESENVDIIAIESDPKDSTRLLIHLEQAIDKLDTVEISYTAGNIISVDSAALVEFSDTLVDNLLPGSYPRLLDLLTSYDGTRIILSFNKEMAISDTSINSFELILLSEQDSTLILADLQVDPENAKNLLLIPENPLYHEFLLAVSYDGTDVQSVDSGLLQAFSRIPLINNSPGYPPVIISAEVNNFGYTLDLGFDKAMGEVSAATTSFSLFVNGKVKDIDSISVSGSTLVLTPVQYIKYADTIMLSYDGTDVISVDRGILQPFDSLVIMNPLPEPVIFEIPGRVDCEMFTVNMGMILEDCTDEGEGQNLGYIDPGDWVEYIVNVTKSDMYTVLIRTASATNGGLGVIQAPDATVLDLDTVPLPPTGGWQSWMTVYALINLEEGTQRLRFYASTSGYNLNWIQFETGNTIPLAIIEGANTNSAGDIIEIHFDKSLASPSVGEENQFTIMAGENTIHVIGIGVKAGSQETLILMLEDFLTESDESITVTYNGGSLKALDNSPIVAFYDIPVENKVNNVPSADFYNITIFPNPVNDRLTIDGLSSGDIVSIYDVYGKEVIHERISHPSVILDLESIPKGVYLIRINTRPVRLIVKR